MTHAHEHNLDAAQREIDRRAAEGEDMSGAKVDPKTSQVLKLVTDQWGRARIYAPGTDYLYRMGTNKGALDVEASTRAAAARLAKLYGYDVHDCNMIG